MKKNKEIQLQEEISVWLKQLLPAYITPDDASISIQTEPLTEHTATACFHSYSWASTECHSVSPPDKETAARVLSVEHALKFEKENKAKKG